MSSVQELELTPPTLVSRRDSKLLQDVTASDGAGDGKSRIPHRLRELVPFLAVSIQFCLIVLLVIQFHLESQTFARLMQLSFAGFVVHHFLPMRMKLPFFALLSVAVTVAVVDDVAALSLSSPGPLLVMIGLGLIGICHLPIPFWSRVALLGGIGAALTVARANSAWLPGLEGIWAVLASMFIFRLMIYLYDLKNRSAPFSLAHAVSYFFMIPNACFPLFPIVDYKGFCKTHFNDEALRIYHTGIQWMFRGVIHLLLYRLVYHYGLLNIAEVRDAGDVAQFMVATYLLYLRVSGQFHIIVGLLHMFGFNLPETHHLYYLASSFTDFWRRINIYWKDFIMKLFFYPVSFRLRRAGTIPAIVLATSAAFFATWLLHSWQWFWFRGSFLFTWQDGAFWAILAVLVLVNAVYEAVFGRRRTLTKSKVGLRDRIVLGLKTAATFTVICALWTLWSSQSAGELQVLAESAMHLSLADAIFILAGLAAIGAAGALWGASAKNVALAATPKAKGALPIHFWRSTATVASGAGLALLISVNDFAPNSRPGALISALRQDRLNAIDLEAQHRGYYEELDTVRANQVLWGNIKAAPPGWTNEWRIFRGRDDFFHCELVPSTSAMLSGTIATTNQWGMRDHEYAKEKPPNSFRILMLGSSHEVGSGVKDDETFENITEDHLNRQFNSDSGQKTELMNMSVAGFSMFEKLYLLEQKGFEFQPDAVLFTMNAVDRMFMINHLVRVVSEGRPVPYDYLQDLFKRVDIDRHSARPVIKHRLEPHAIEMYKWLFARLRAECERRGIQAFVVYRPMPNLVEKRNPIPRAELLKSAAEAGLEVIDLSAAFQPFEDREKLVLAAWDDHTNATGHRLLAEELFKQLHPRLTVANQPSGK